MADNQLSILVTLRDQASAALKSLSTRVSAAGNDMQKSLNSASSGAGNLQKSLGGLGGAATGSSVGFGTLTGSIITANLALKALQMGFDLLVSTLKNTAQFEQYRIGFETMIGDTDKAKKALQELTDFAIATPFDTSQVVELSQRLMAMGTETENLTETMKILGDTASVTGMDKLPNLVLAYGQVRTASRLTGMELRQFTEAGVPLLDMLAKQYGKNTAEIRTMVEAGSIGFRNVEQALIDFTSKGGKGFNAMQNQQKSLLGMWANFRDTVKVTGMEILGMAKTGDILKGSFFDQIKTGASEALVFFAKYRTSFVAIGKLILNTVVFIGTAIAEAFKLVAAVFNGIAGVITKVLNAIAGTQKSFGEWLVSAWNAALSNIGEAITWLAQKAVWVVDLMNNLPGIDIDSSGITASAKRVSGSLSKMSISISDFQANTADATSSIEYDFSNMGLAAKDSAETTSKAAKKAADEAKKLQEELVQNEAKAAIARVKAIEKVRTKYNDAQKDIGESLSKLRDEHVKNAADIVKSIDSVNKSITDLNKKYNEDLGAENKAVGEAYVEQQQKIVDLNKEIKDTLEEAYSADNFSTYTQKLADLRAELAKEEAALKANAGLEATNAADIAEAKRRASLTEFQRSIEDIKKKKDDLLAARNEKLAEYEQERKDLEIKLQNESKLYFDKELALKNMRIQAAIDYEAYMANLESITANSADKMVEQMQRVLDMRSRVAGADTSQSVSEATKAVTGYASGGVVPGIGFSDSVPALLTPNEEVITAGDRKSLVSEVKNLVSALTAANARPNVSQNITQVINSQTDISSSAAEMFFYMRTARFT